MACTTSTQNITLDAASVTWGKEHEICLTPDATLTGGEYFKLSSPNKKFIVYHTVNAVGTVPSVVGYTNIAVALPTAYTVANYMTLAITALEAVGVNDFLAEVSSDALSLKISCLDVGAPLEASVDVTTDFTIAVVSAGFGGDLGKTKEGIEVSLEVTEYEVKTNQDGETVVDKILTGLGASMSMSLLEMTEAKWELVVGKGYGDTLTVGTDVLVGMGSSKINQSSFDLGGRLTLHPIRLDASDRSEDFTFWKTLPVPSSINYDALETKAMSVTFTALQDSSIDSKINMWAKGDWRVDVRA